MALTKEDLQAIGDLMDRKLEPIQGELKSLREDVQGLKEDVQTLKTDVQTLKTKVTTLETDVQTLKSDMQSVKESQETIWESQLVVEHEWFPKITAHLDASAGSFQKGMENDRRITVLERVVEDHGVRIFKLEEAV